MRIGTGLGQAAGSLKFPPALFLFLRWGSPRSFSENLTEL
jgi:hypothetical protein